MQQGYVYKITSPSNKIYIGSTNNITKRWGYYKSYNCKVQIKLYRSFIKYGVENHIFEVIWTGFINELLSKEHEFGILFNVLDKDKGLNLSLPKSNDIWQCISEELREKRKLTWKGRKHTEESKLKMSMSNKGKIISEETRIKMSINNKGKKLSDETKKKIGLASLGRKQTKESLEKRENSRKKTPIIQMDMEGNFIREWNSAADIARAFNKINGSHITACCKNKRNFAFDYKWKYK